MNYLLQLYLYCDRQHLGLQNIPLNTEWINDNNGDLAQDFGISRGQFAWLEVVASDAVMILFSNYVFIN